MTGILLCCAAIVARWYYRVFPSQAVYPTEAAETPDPVDDVHDNYQRAQWFTGADEVPAAPMVVAGDDLMVAKLVGELQSLYAAYRRGEDVYADARREPSPEVQR